MHARLTPVCSEHHYTNATSTIQSPLEFSQRHEGGRHHDASSPKPPSAAARSSGSTPPPAASTVPQPTTAAPSRPGAASRPRLVPPARSRPPRVATAPRKRTPRAAKTAAASRGRTSARCAPRLGSPPWPPASQAPRQPQRLPHSPANNNKALEAPLRRVSKTPSQKAPEAKPASNAAPFLLSLGEEGYYNEHNYTTTTIITRHARLTDSSV
ncbi:mucin-7-like [Portunus trituberculatus]|uniref:Uncharacterized protein n=1 Tax=Portunus trituberculatus TaxID=210409 RepID=A0A5B7FHB4_PORTR|nr:mucin-7-like [Portunus trituberculatus]MPC44786.1 hypothetical protein [Portunus trituberculatus]